MIDYGHFIGGKRVAGTSGRKQDVMQPMDGSVRGTVALASQAELRAAVENAKAAQPKWAATNPQRRVRVLMKFLELVARSYDELADILLYVVRFADKAGIDLEASAERKIASNAAKYPADKFRGSDRKYDE